ncbi:MAG: UvrD-helicase domain-containing protein, partial [Lentimicrobiaceae bacterium]|nr:UvrD-helicase domain-containing protein [Lentimicrobiaceae bacterium]
MSETTIGGNFHVYKSSAGSGKTHTLTMIYLGIILKRPSNFRHILAITFTNKAANEIKQRIVDTLSWLACTNLEAVTGYDRQKVEQLLKLTGLQNATLQENAQKALGLILHHYHDFAVSTIDSFVHRIIRTFAFDLKLMSNFEVEMETDMLLSLTVDKVLADAGCDKDLTEVLVNYIENQADHDES